MPRVQTQYQPQAAGLQAVSSPDIQAQRARFDPNDSGAFQLAKALGALPTEQLNGQIQAVTGAQMQKDRMDAEAYANSMTVEQLGHKIKSGEMLPSKSPAFAAALQHIYGENAQNSFERDTLTKIQTGELKFDTPQQMDEYITKGRNEHLSGQSEYTIAGFDKGYNGFREKAINANASVVNNAAVERGVQEASDNLGNVLLQVKDPTFKGDPAATLVQRYQLLRKTSLLRDDAAKTALDNLVTNIATSGDTDLVNKLLSQKLDNGVTVKAVIGDVKAVGLTQHADAMNDKNQRQRVDVELRPFLAAADKGELDEKALTEWAGKNEKWVTTSTLHAITSGDRSAKERALREIQRAQLQANAERSVSEANQVTAAAIRGGNLAFLPQQKVVSSTGEVKDFDTTAAAQKIISEDVQRSQMPIGKATEYWATNNVENPEWQKEIQAGASNVASVGWNYDGKNIGQLNPQGQKALETFMRINTTHPAYAEKLVGSKKDYETMSNIQFLVEKGGFPNVSDAASLVNQANRSGIEKGDFGSMHKAVQSAVDDVVNPHWYSGRVSWYNGLFGNSEPNLTAVSSSIRQRAELLVMSGQVKDASAAVKASVEYLANPAVTTKVNNTLYFNKDMPPVPRGEDAGHWMDRFINEVPSKLAKDQKLSGDVRLEPNTSGGFTAWIGGVPLVDPQGKVQTYRKDEVGQWIDGAYKADQYKGMADRNYQLWKDAEMKKVGDSMKKMGVSNSAFGQPLGINSETYSRATYERLLKEGKITQGK